MGSRVLGRAIGTAVVMVALMSVAGPVGAVVAHCFSRPEAEAQEAVRYQAKLMVLSDTCGAEIYRRFTIRNRDAIVRYQEEMIDHFRRIDGARHAEQRFDSFLTGLANQFSLTAGSEPLTSLCSELAEFLAQADKLDHDTFHQFVTALAAKPANDSLRCAD